jgi:hypothetical protein
VAGLYEFVLNATTTSASNYMNLHLWKNGTMMFTTAIAKPSYFAGGAMVAKMYMTPSDSAFFTVLIGGSNTTTANLLLNYDVAHWCSIRMVEN